MSSFCLHCLKANCNMTLQRCRQLVSLGKKWRWPVWGRRRTGRQWRMQGWKAEKWGSANSGRSPPQGPKLDGPAKARARPFSLSLATGCRWGIAALGPGGSLQFIAVEGLGRELSAAIVRDWVTSPCSSFSKGHACAHSRGSVHPHSPTCLSRPSPAPGIDWMGRKRV